MPTLAAALLSYNEVVNVVGDFGAVGDGVTDDTAAFQAAFNACFGTTGSPHGISFWLNKVLYIPPGSYKITSALTITKLVGGRIIGGGRLSTQITQATANGSCIVTNGCSRSHFSDFSLVANGTGTCFDLDWDGTAGGNALQSNQFINMDFTSGDFGVNIAKGGYMGSENLFQNCFFTYGAIAGLKTSAANALQNTILGGNFQGCARGIWILNGSVPVVAGVGFQTSTDYDIYISNSANDTISVIGCRSESVNFMRNGNSHSVKLDGVSMTNGADGYLYAGNNSPAIIDNCVSIAGAVSAGNGNLCIRNCAFGRTDWIENIGASALVEIENVQKGGTYNSVGDGNPIMLTKRRMIGSATYTYDVTSI